MNLNRNIHNRYSTNIAKTIISEDTSTNDTDLLGNSSTNNGGNGSNVTVIYLGGGLSPEDSAKLASIEEGAQVNLNAFSHVTVYTGNNGTVVGTIDALSLTDTNKIWTKGALIASLTNDNIITVELDPFSIDYNSLANKPLELDEINDRWDATKIVRFPYGTIYGDYVANTPGAGAALTIDETTGLSYLEVDRLYVRLKAYFDTLVIKRKESIGGEFIVSPANMKCISVTEFTDYYRCFFLKELDGQSISNDFTVGTQAICKLTNADSTVAGNTLVNKYYWRLVTGVGEDYIDLSKTDCDTDSDIPETGDTIVALGHRTDIDRQSAIIISSIDNSAPHMVMYQGITGYTLVNKATVEMGYNQSTSLTEMNMFGKTYIGASDLSSYINFNPLTLILDIKGNLKISSGELVSDLISGITEDLNTYVNTFNNDISNLLDLIDGQIISWFLEYDPTTSNYPANEWTTDALKLLHANDTFTNTLTGGSWRWQSINNVWSWGAIADTATQQALLLAALAQDTADKKRRIFTTTPTTPYDLGDLWVQGSTGDIKHCVLSRLTGSYTASDWVISSKYTDNTVANIAKDRADAAQQDADTANQLLADIASDNKFTPGEKQSVQTEWNIIYSEKPLNDAQATLFEVSHSNYDSKYSALSTYLTPLLANLNVTDTIVPTEFRNAFKNYYDERTNLLNSIATKSRTLALDAQNSADQAQTDADNANAIIAAITSDNILSANEKPGERSRWNDLYNEKSGIDSQAILYNITTERTNYDNAFQALATYLNNGTTWSSGVPNWINDSNISSDTVIVGSTYRSKWNDYYSYRQTLLNKITDNARNLIQTAQNTANTALSNAQNALNDATSALNNINTIISDNVLSSLEKSSERSRWNIISAEKSNIDSQAIAFGLSHSNYDTAFQNLANYLNNGTTWSSGIPSWLSDSNLSINTTIVGSTYRSNWGNYYNERTLLLNAISTKAKQLADAALVTANNATTAAQNALNAANQAQLDADNALTDATNALGQLTNIVSDNILSAVEKSGERDRWNIIASEKSIIDSQADSFSVSRSTYDSNFQALATYLNNNTTWSSGVPSWLSDANLGTNTTIVGTTYRSKWQDYYDARTALLNAISSKAKTLADNAQISANNAANAAQQASQAAADALTSADTANNLLSDIANDNKFTPIEKQQVKLEWDSIVSERTKNAAQADLFVVSRTSYDTAYDSLNTYITPLLTSLTTTSNIVGTTFRSTFKTYYDARTDLLNSIASKARTLANTAQSTADTAQTAAGAAQTSANTANNLLSDLASDNKLTAVEKQQIKTEWDSIVSEKTKNDTQADNFIVSRTAYDNAYNSLSSYITPLLSSLTTTSDITGTTLRSTFKSYYDARTDLLNTIATKAKTLADNALTSANNANNTAQLAVQAASNAQTAADNALTSATQANTKITIIASDNYLSANEKPAERSRWNDIINERTDIRSKADSFGISKTNYDTAFQNLANYLNNGVTWTTGIPTWINDTNLSTDTAISGSTYRDKWNQYYYQRQLLLNAIAAKAKQLADNALNAANNAQSTADTANSKADTALTNYQSIQYLKAALLEDTVVSGGLILSSVLSLGYTSGSTFNVMSGTSGLYDSNITGGGVAGWYGGAMKDKTWYTEATMPLDVAKTLFRFDGSGYIGNLNIFQDNTWTADTTLKSYAPSFEQIVFKRATSLPAAPTGGTYQSSIPTGWSATIPAGTGNVYAAMRTYAYDTVAEITVDSVWRVFITYMAEVSTYVKGYFSSAELAPPFNTTYDTSSPSGWTRWYDGANTSDAKWFVIVEQSTSTYPFVQLFPYGYTGYHKPIHYYLKSTEGVSITPEGHIIAKDYFLSANSSLYTSFFGGGVLGGSSSAGGQGGYSSFSITGTGNAITSVDDSSGSLEFIKGSTFLTSHQTIYNLTLNAGAFTSGVFDPNSSAKTINVPTQTSHLTNNSGFITANNLSLSNSGSGNAVTGITYSGGIFTITKGSTFSLSGHTHAFAELTTKPTTIAGYGITDINTYAPTLTGVGASGTWNINVLGYSHTLSNTLNSLDANNNYYTDLVVAWKAWGISTNTPENSYTNGISFGTPDVNYGFQIAKSAFSHNLYVRDKQTTWSAWRVLLDASNYSSYALPLSGGQLTGQLSLLQGTGGGIIFPNDSFGGGGDSASIKLLNPVGGEATEMTFTMTNDVDDIINFSVPSIDGVKINRYTVWNAGNFTNLNQLTTRNFIDLQNKPTTLSGYGITDALLKSDINVQVGGTKNSQMLWSSWNNSDVYGGAIQIREYGNVDDSQSNWYYSPAITFHWGNRAARRFGMRSDGQFAIDNSPILSANNYSSYALPLSGGTLTGSLDVSVGGNNVANFKSSRSIGVVTLAGNGTYGTRLDIKNAANTASVIQLNFDGSGYFASNVTATNYLRSDGNTVWHSGNDGSGSGLDADLWRGYTPENINVASATKLQTTRSIWGQNFDGSGNVSGAMSGVTSITMSGALSGGTTSSFSSYSTASRFYTGYDSGVTNSMSCSNWFRSNGSSGWYNETYGGGIYMTDTTYVRVYNGKSFWVDNSIVSTTAFKSPSFTSGLTTGSGMQFSISGSEWTGEIDNLVVRKQLRITEMLVSKKRAINGSLSISSAAGKIKTVVTNGTNYEITLEDDNSFSAGDLMYCQTFSNTFGLKYYLVQVDSISGSTIIIATSRFSGMSTPAAGDDVSSNGSATDVARRGLITLKANDNNKPRITIYDGINSSTLTGKEKVVIGDLTGITNSAFGTNQPSGYGIYTDNGYFAGTIASNSGTIGGFEIGNGRIGIDSGVAGSGNGMFLYNDVIGFNASNKQVIIGPYAPPAAAYRLGWFSNTTSSWDKNFGLIFSIKNSNDANYAISGTGDCMLNGIVLGYKLNYVWAPSTSVISQLNINDGLKILIINTAGGDFSLPTITNVRNYLDISDTSIKFAIKLTLMHSGASSHSTNVYGRTTSISFLNNSIYPYLRYNDYQNPAYRSMGNGDTCEWMLTWNGTIYDAYLISALS